VWSNFAVRAKSIFRKTPPQPKEPRKKIELQLKIQKQQFDEQIQELERVLDRPYLPKHSLMLGRKILQSANRFQELQFVRLNQSRLQALPSSLIDPSDFSLWVIWEMKNLTDEMKQFITSLE
jgi:hypothetical protein